MLHTLSLRPPVMYGEFDPWYVVSALKSAARRPDGSLVSVGDGSARLQTAYVGNVAWAHVCAARALAVDPGLTSGRPYFITDDTPVVNSFESMRPFLAAKGYTLSENRVPYPLAYACCWSIDWLLWLVKPVFKVNLEVNQIYFRLSFPVYNWQYVTAKSRSSGGSLTLLHRPTHTSRTAITDVL